MEESISGSRILQDAGSLITSLLKTAYLRDTQGWTINSKNSKYVSISRAYFHNGFEVEQLIITFVVSHGNEDHLLAGLSRSIKRVKELICPPWQRSRALRLPISDRARRSTTVLLGCSVEYSGNPLCSRVVHRLR